MEILLLFNPSLKGEGMKTIVVGDMHQKFIIRERHIGDFTIV